MTTAAPALETVGLEKNFGGLMVTRNLSLKIAPGARHALIGPNGAGKTTVINLLTGVLKPSSGRIMLEGRDITDLPVHARVRQRTRVLRLSRAYATTTFERRQGAARTHYENGRPISA